MLNRNLNASFNTFSLTQGATLQQVLDIARLLPAYNEFLGLFSEAEFLFIQGDPRLAFNTVHKIWMNPYFVPALLLCECYYARQLIFPAWSNTGKLYMQHLLKDSGGTRPIIIPNKSTRICMGVVNTLLQPACKSWSWRTTGFRPGCGTHTAISMLAESASSIMHAHGKIYILSFDIRKAFNSVNIKHMFHTLNLKALPHGIKYLIWKWQHSPVFQQALFQPDSAPFVHGLAQGFSYSPTLFAWYLDVLLVQHCSLIAYADNFAGVYKSQYEAQHAVQRVLTLLRASGLTINEKSITITVRHHNSAPSLYPWLGHALSLPDCNIIYNKFEQKAPVLEPVVISQEKWYYMLQSTNWVNNVLNMEWRFGVV